MSRIKNFYSRPCGRGDGSFRRCGDQRVISTHAPAGGATRKQLGRKLSLTQFLLTPLREGRRPSTAGSAKSADFYSRPCGRGDVCTCKACGYTNYFYSRPCGRGDIVYTVSDGADKKFLLTPLREGRLLQDRPASTSSDFYSRPCGRGDCRSRIITSVTSSHFYSRPCGRGDLMRSKAFSAAPYFYSRPCGRGDPCAKNRLQKC